jgi:purine-binding chemotaxis protein CheW
MIVAGETTQQLVVFSLGDEEYALPIGQVQEIIRFTKPRAIASPLAFLAGVISLRGRVIPILDLTVRLGLPGRTVSAQEAKIVIVEGREGAAGIVVSGVEEVLLVEAEQVDELAVARGGFAFGIVKLDEGRLVVLLDAAELCAGLRVAEAA